MEPESRFATKEEIFSPGYAAINESLATLNRQHDLSDHTDLNAERFPWSAGKFAAPAVYASRMWEYPYAILAAGIEPGMRCADIGCGTSPFTFYLASLAGQNCVTGFDPDEIDSRGEHSMFGANRRLLEKAGIAFERCDMSVLRAEDASFDRVFCLSVLEHIEEPEIWQKGIREMVRILKPGGLLILTLDLGLQMPLTNIFEVIRYSGLAPAGPLKYAWPRERFVRLGDTAMDVFGLALIKSDRQIFMDYEQTRTEAEYAANRIFVPEITASHQVQIGKDLIRRLGVFRIILKSLLGKYNKKK